MGDSINALNQQSRQSSLLGILANPTVANPLAAISAGTQAASQVMDLREKRARQATGQAFLNAIDPKTGQFSADRLNQNLAADPNTAMNAQQSSQQGVTNATNAYSLHMTRLSASDNAMSALRAQYGNNPPQAAINAAIDQEVARGIFTQAEGATAKAQYGADPAANGQLILRNHIANLSAQAGLLATNPELGTQNIGGAIVGTAQQPIAAPNAGVLTSAGGVTTGPPPGTVLETGQWVADGKGGRVWQAGRVPASSVVSPGGAPFPASGTPAGASTAPPPPPTNSTVRSPGAYAPPVANAPPPPSPGVSVGGKASAPGPQSQNAPPAGAVSSDVAVIQGGMQTAQNAPSSAVPGAVAAAGPAAGTQTAQNYPPAGTPLSPSVVQTPQGPFLPSGPPSGYNETLNNDIKTHTDASLGASDQRKNLQAGENAFEALRLAGNYTGSGTGTAAALYGWLQARAPQWAIPQGDMTDTAWRQVLAKNLLRFAQESGLRMNTDLGMNEALKGTANADAILPNANREILINDIGNTRQRLAQTLLMPSPTGDGSVVKHFQNYTSDTDPRAFAWDLRSGPERAAIEAEVAKDKSGKAEKRLNQGLEDANRLGLIKLPSTAPRSQAAPAPGNPVAAAPANALLAASGGAPANALAA